MNTTDQQNILILDYSTDQFETPVIKKWLPASVTALFIDTEQSFPDNLIQKKFTHIIHTGSTLSVTEEAPFTKKAEKYIRTARDKGLAQMGICYGHQLVCKALAGDYAVRSSPNGLEAGWGDVKFTDNAQKLFKIKKIEKIWQHHFDEVIELPEGSELLATNSHTKIQAYINHEQNLLGTQFHPEFDKVAGNNWFLNDRELLEKNNYNVDEMIKQGPSIEAGKIFFNFFLNKI